MYSQVDQVNLANTKSILNEIIKCFSLALNEIDVPLKLDSIVRTVIKCIAWFVTFCSHLF